VKRALAALMVATVAASISPRHAARAAEAGAVAKSIADLEQGGMERSRAAAKELARAGDPAVDPLVQLMGRGTPLDRRWACVALGAMDRSVVRAVPPLAVASSDPDGEVRLAAVEGLGSWTSSEAAAREALARRLDDADRAIRLRAAVELSATPPAAGAVDSAAAVTNVLIEALESPVLAMRLSALEGLGRAGAQAGDRGLVALRKALGDPYAAVRSAAPQALLHVASGSGDVAADLCAHLADPDAWVATSAMRALAEVSAPVAPCVGPLLHDAQGEVRRRAAWLLSARGAREPEALAALAAVASSTAVPETAAVDPVVQRYAASASWMQSSSAAARAPSRNEP